MIKICPACSNVDAGKVKEIVPEDQVDTGCISECGQHEGKSFGYIGDELVIKDTEQEFLAAVKTITQQ